MSEIPKRPSDDVAHKGFAKWASARVAHEHAVAKALWDEVQDTIARLERLGQGHAALDLTVERVKASGWQP